MMVVTCVTGGNMADPDDEVPPSAADTELLWALAGALGPDPVPDGLIERAAELLVMVDLNTELVALLQEAATGLDAAGTRGDADIAAPLEFVSIDGAVTIEIVLDQDGVAGQLIGADATFVTLERPSGASVDAPVDALGRFHFSASSPGPARVRVLAGDITVSTDWFVM
jgi:hypothetical protein